MKRTLMLAAMSMLAATLFAQPINDLCTNATNLTVDGPCIPGTTINSGTEDPSIDPTNYPTDVWYYFTATTNQTVVYVHPEMNLDPDLYIYDNCGGTQLDYAAAGLTAGALDSISIATTAGVTYYISVVGWMDNPSGDFCIEVLNTSVNNPYDPCVDFMDISVTDPCLNDNVNQDTLIKGYRFSAISSNTKITLQYNEPAYYPVVAVAETDCNGTIIVNWGDGTHVGNTFIVEFPTSVGASYFFVVMHSDPTISYQFPLDYCVDIDVTLGTTNLDAEALSIFPNPAKTEFTLNTKNGTGTIELIDMTGRQVLAKQIDAQSTTLNIENLTNGIYTVRYFDGTNTVSTKLIKE